MTTDDILGKRKQIFLDNNNKIKFLSIIPHLWAMKNIDSLKIYFIPQLLYFTDMK